MINIRYHIVSITAIFLALGIGTLLGSTFLDRATVDQLDRNIRNAEARIDDTQAVNDRLKEDVENASQRDEALIESSETVLDGLLTDTPVLLVVAPGVDKPTVDTLRRILANADADLRGSLALRDDLMFSGGVDGGLADTLELDEDDPEAARAEVQGLLVDALVAAGAPAEPVEEPPVDGEEPEPGTTTTTAPGSVTTAPGDTGTTSTTTTSTTPPTTTTSTTTTAPDDTGEGGPDDEATAPDGQTPDVLTALIEADLVALEPGPAYTAERPVLETTGYQYVFVSEPDPDPAANELLLGLLPDTETEPRLPAVVVSATVVEPLDESAEDPEPTAVALVRADPARAALYDTVDEIDTYLGLQSTVVILRAGAGSSVGHYGQGDGATALAPAGR